MKLAVLLYVLLAQIVTAPTPAPTATPDWHVYDDPAMHFRVPDGYFPMMRPQQIDIDKLGEDPTIVMGWVYPVKDHIRKLAVQQEYFVGDAASFLTQFKTQLRDGFDSPFFKNEQRTTLKNGMPALFVEMTAGQGFDVQKFYFLVWADGQRGVALGIQAQMDDLDAQTARQIMSDVTAVQYPANRQ
jgi:hypothetical protein